MQLINALVTSPDDLDFRIHLRNEFLRCGLKKILPVSEPDNTYFSSFHIYRKFKALNCFEGTFANFFLSV